jgi:aminoglycoside N3'-acetyltransferase
MRSRFALKEQALELLGEKGIRGIRILRQAARDLHQTFVAPPVPTYPIAISEIRETLLALGIAKGDTVHVHASIQHLMRGATRPPAEPVPGPRTYAKALLALLLELVGEDGTLCMATDFNRPPGWLKRLLAGSEIDEDVFDPARSPSYRGLLSEYFRRRPDVHRSLHPFYNVTAWGRSAQELVGEHHLSTPYVQDVHSPWYKVTRRGGKVLLLGRTFDVNSMVHLVEYLHPGEYPRPLFLSGPVPMYYLDASRVRQRIDVLMHHSGVPGSPLYVPQALHKFADYIDERHQVYRRKPFHEDVGIVCYDAQAQYDAFLAEMRRNVTWYDPQFLR